MRSLEEIKSEVEGSGNVLTISMEELREAAGAGRLGVHVREQISDSLAGLGLGHVPQELPSYQHEQVRLYKRGTQVGQVIETVLQPGEHNDKKLVNLFGDKRADFEGMVAKIRAIVGD